MWNNEIVLVSIFQWGFLLVSTEVLFWEKEWAIGYNSMKF